MTTYTAYFRTDAEYATYEFKAETPEQALALAQKLYDDDPLELMFESYDDLHPVNEIEISGPTGEFALWRDEDLWLKLSAREVLEALEECSSFLDAASRLYEQNGLRRQAAKLLTALSAARATIAKAKGGAA
jgi:hypothetical protein